MKRSGFIMLLAVGMAAMGLIARRGQAGEAETTSDEVRCLTVRLIASSDTFKTIIATQIPTGYAISLALPTRRAAGRPAFAWVASPRTLIPGTAPTSSAPDRWWIMDAQSGSLLIYSLVSVQPFTSGVPAILSANPTTTGPDMKAAAEDALATIDKLAPAFFANDPADCTSRANLLKDIAILYGEDGVTAYRQLVPDFFQWLEGPTG